MKIRSVTCFVTVDETGSSESLRKAGDLAGAARVVIPREGFDLQTTRVAIQPLGEFLQSVPPVEFAKSFERSLRQAGFDYGALAIKQDRLFPQVASLVRATESIFASIRIASSGEGINLHAIRAAAKVIYELANTTPDGFGNFRFAAAANVPPSVPFFPAAFHDGLEPAFAFATEAADLALEAFTSPLSLDQARLRFVESLEQTGARLLRAGQALEAEFGLRFAGIDFSLAPYPEQARSMGTALERLSGARFGMRGTLFAAAFVTDCLRRANFRRAGFSGLFLPLMEDWTMAERSKDGLYTIDSLLLYSTVCGTGLDTVPLAGDTDEKAIAALLLDLAALAVKLDKPLTARLIPVPGVRAGEMTHFSFEYFANARAFGLENMGGPAAYDTDELVNFQ